MFFIILVECIYKPVGVGPIVDELGVEAYFFIRHTLLWFNQIEQFLVGHASCKSSLLSWSCRKSCSHNDGFAFLLIA